MRYGCYGHCGEYGQRGRQVFKALSGSGIADGFFAGVVQKSPAIPLKPFAPRELFSDSVLFPIDENVQSASQQSMKREVRSTSISMRLIVHIVSYALLLALGATTTARATILVRESFLLTDYTVDTDLVGQNGGTGFTGNWESSDAFAASVRYEPRSEGLSYPNLISEGGALEHFRSSGSEFEKIVRRDLDFSPPVISGSNVAYFGFLFEAQNADSIFSVNWNSTVNRETLFLYDGTAMRVRGGGSVGGPQSTVFLPAAPGQTHLVLVRISDNTTSEFNEFYDTFDIWLNPDLTDLGEPDASDFGIWSKFSGENTDLMADEININASLSPGESFTVDEFFYTDSLTSIPVIPEPALVSFLAGFTAAFAFIRHRR